MVVGSRNERILSLYSCMSCTEGILENLIIDYNILGINLLKKE